jgi:branched-chain amino acid aminotransferase
MSAQEFCQFFSLFGYNEFMYYVNGVYTREEDAKINVVDLGLLRGFGVFDYLRTYDNKPFHLWDHLERLKNSANVIGLHLPKSLEEIADIIYRLLEQNGFAESGIKVVVTGGGSSDGLMPEQKSGLIVITTPFKPFADYYYTRGVRAITTNFLRPFPKAKTTHYISAIVALQKAKEFGAEEAIYMNGKNEILESTTSNLFVFKNGVLVTSASDQILMGITRKLVLQIAKEKFPIEERPITLQELGACEEAFLTSSNKELVPLSQIDHFSFTIGEKTRELRALFNDYVRNYSKILTPSSRTSI